MRWAVAVVAIMVATGSAQASCDDLTANLGRAGMKVSAVGQNEITLRNRQIAPGGEVSILCSKKVLFTGMKTRRIPKDMIDMTAKVAKILYAVRDPDMTDWIARCHNDAVLSGSAQRGSDALLLRCEAGLTSSISLRPR